MNLNACLFVKAILLLSQILQRERSAIYEVYCISICLLLVRQLNEVFVVGMEGSEGKSHFE